ncbi:MAG: hypothetical protein IT236_18905 [Bacteroidia bacterium]|nr:hypothetical protein [Bacteroidia bacterium]
MLKNKKAIYILIPLNLFIWGFFIYRFYSAYNSYDEPVATSELKNYKALETKDSIDYKLKLNYKDPFLKNHSKSDANLGNRSNTDALREIKPTAPKPAPVLVKAQAPEIKFLGLIKNTATGITMALVSINGQSHTIKPNETVDGILFKSLNRDSLVAKWGKERMVIRR